MNEQGSDAHFEEEQDLMIYNEDDNNGDNFDNNDPIENDGQQSIQDSDFNWDAWSDKIVDSIKDKEDVEEVDEEPNYKRTRQAESLTDAEIEFHSWQVDHCLPRPIKDDLLKRLHRIDNFRIEDLPCEKASKKKW